MFLIVGLGNPGLRYAYTRHNVGFMFIDCLAHELGFPDFREKFDSHYAEKTLENREKVWIQKPQTYMNLSGRAVSQIMAFYKISPENVFVIRDDLDIPPLDIRIKFAGSSGGHNGVRDIEKAIGKNFWQIRIGIGRPLEKAQVADYVLSPFYKDELELLPKKVYRPISQNMIELLLNDNKAPVIEKIKRMVA